MVVFNTEYYSTLDRGFYHRDSSGSSSSSSPVEVEFPQSQEIQSELSYREIGTTADANVHPILAVQAKIREGVGKLEIPFFGAGKGGFGGQNATPEILGKLEREQLRELAKINDIKLSTHATTNISGLSGLTQEGFSDDRVQETVKEIQKAIDFAAHATTGGPVVFHVQEWNRPIFQAGLSAEEMRNSNKQGVFREFGTEIDKSPIYLADKDTGKITAIKKDQKFYFPEEEFDDKTGMWHVKIKNDAPVVKQYNFNDAVKYIKDKFGKDGALDGKSDAEIALYGHFEQELKQAQGEVKRFLENAVEMREQLQKLSDSKKFIKKLWDSTPEKDRWKLLKKEGENIDLFIPGEVKDPVKYVEERERQIRNNLDGYEKIIISQQEKVKQIEEQQTKYKPIEEVGLERSAATIAKLGMRAMDATTRNRKDLIDPIFVSPEGYEPQVYGSHPDEMRKIIQKSREEMARMLITRGMSRNEAKDLSEKHIRATLDTGHLNMWRKHFFEANEAKPEDQRDSPEVVERKYNKWYKDQAQRLADEKIVGQVHVSDNWGYDDEHLTAGQGNAPIKDVVKIMEKAGVKDFIAERGSFNAQTILPDTLAEIGSPIYALDRSFGRRVNFSNIRNAHFGYNAPPNYIAGAYAPSNEWRLWSEIPFE